ncbi:hypothetical protein KAZ57_01175 [Patescibacteria group bacterium]|nr:hypothetical protein [Patescibacteria group bacterium]
MTILEEKSFHTTVMGVVIGFKDKHVRIKLETTDPQVFLGADTGFLPLAWYEGTDELQVGDTVEIIIEEETQGPTSFAKVTAKF